MIRNSITQSYLDSKVIRDLTQQIHALMNTKVAC